MTYAPVADSELGESIAAPLPPSWRIGTSWRQRDLVAVCAIILGSCLVIGGVILSRSDSSDMDTLRDRETYIPPMDFDWGPYAKREKLDLAMPGAKNMTRGERLCKGGLKVLYHQTDRLTCAKILQNGFDMRLAKAGNLGPGAYFADEAWVTGYKTRHTGCVIKLLVRLGSILELGNRWLQDAGRRDDTCDPLLGYKLARRGGEGYDSVTTIKHGRERSIFFIDQIVDMVAYHTGTWYRNMGSPTGYYLNGRKELNYPETCDPASFPEVDEAPVCTDPKPSAYACDSGYHHWRYCFLDYRGNVPAILPQ